MICKAIGRCWLTLESPLSLDQEVKPWHGFFRQRAEGLAGGAASLSRPLVLYTGVSCWCRLGVQSSVHNEKQGGLAPSSSRI